ncbi:hypothetical protein NQZ79_g3696 [Umbelopsis isabellina]|nr:hypothetical protein NQZ79_g3696 [Umbelopsis isabellina]
MTDYDTFDPRNCGFTFLQLTPQEEFVPACADDHEEYQTDDCTADLAVLSVLAPEVTSCCTSNGQVQTLEPEINLFCPELGVLTEEPEPIDPDFDYEADAIQRGVYKRERKLHIDLEDESVPELVGNEIESAVSSGCFVDSAYASRIDALCMSDRIDGMSYDQGKADVPLFNPTPFAFQPLIA